MSIFWETLIDRIERSLRNDRKYMQKEKHAVVRRRTSEPRSGFVQKALPAYSYTSIPSPKCREAVMSRRAYVSMVAESYANGTNESGGVMLGHKGDGKWYIVEATDPGFDAYHTPDRHEMNNRYVNYLYRVLSRLYSDELYLVGFWHRHPGTFNRFSSLDDTVNTSYAEVIGEGTLSFLINFVPEPVLTCYFLDSDDMCYHKVNLTVSNQELREKKYLKYASSQELCERAVEMQEEMVGKA